MFRAKATILTTGWVSRLWFYAGNEWRAGWGHQGFGAATNTGDGIAMALRAGAELINMEASQPGAPGYGAAWGPYPESGLSDKRRDSHWPATVVDSQGGRSPPPCRPTGRRTTGCPSATSCATWAPAASTSTTERHFGSSSTKGEWSTSLSRLATIAEVARRVVFEVNDRNDAGWANSIKALASRGHGHDLCRRSGGVQDPIIQRYGRLMKSGGSGGGLYRHRRSLPHSPGCTPPAT